MTRHSSVIGAYVMTHHSSVVGARVMTRHSSVVGARVCVALQKLYNSLLLLSTSHFVGYRLLAFGHSLSFDFYTNLKNVILQSVVLVL
jgi:hypothetical protein